MSVALLDGFAWEPGLAAGYIFGRHYFEACVVHFTAGACGGDRAVGLLGYFPAYIPREADCGPGATQFAEMDATTFHACEANTRATGIEFEKRTDDVTLTQYQLDKGRAAFQQLIAAGIAATYRDTPDDRIPVGGPLSGFVTHRSLRAIACDEHYDGLPQSEIDYMMGTGTGPVGEDFEMLLQATSDSTINPNVTAGSVWQLGGTMLLAVPTTPPGAALLPLPGNVIGEVSVQLDRINRSAERILAAPDPAPPVDTAALLLAAANRAEVAIRTLSGIANHNRARLVAVVRPAVQGV